VEGDRGGTLAREGEEEEEKQLKAEWKRFWKVAVAVAVQEEPRQRCSSREQMVANRLSS
jgi:hypothetical protein